MACYSTPLLPPVPLSLMGHWFLERTEIALVFKTLNTVWVRSLFDNHSTYSDFWLQKFSIYSLGALTAFIQFGCAILVFQLRFGCAVGPLHSWRFAADRER